MRILARSILVAAPICLAQAAPVVYDFNDPKQVNTISFSLDSTLEPFAGLAYGVGGQVTFDPDRPEATTGKITVPSGLVLVPNTDMLRTLQSDEWLDTANHPEISFEFRRVAKVEKKPGREFVLEVEGEMRIKGKAKNLSLTISATHLPDQVRERGGGREGDLLALRTSFTFRRADFDIKPTISPKKVGESVVVTSAIVGYGGGAPSPKP